MLHLLTLAQSAVDTATSNTPTIASALTLLAVVAKSAFDYRKGQRRDQRSTSSARETAEQLGRLEKKLDDSIAEQRAFCEETRQEYFGLERRVDGLQSHVIGPDGKNGLRSRVERLEDSDRRQGPKDRREIE